MIGFVFGVMDGALAFLIYRSAFSIRFLGEIPERNFASWEVLAPVIVLVHGIAGAMMRARPRFSDSLFHHGIGFLMVTTSAYILREQAGAFPSLALFYALLLLPVASWCVHQAAPSKFASTGPALILATAENVASLRNSLGPGIWDTDWAPAGTPWDMVRIRLQEGNYRVLLLETAPRDADIFLSLLYAAEAGQVTVLLRPDHPDHPDMTPFDRWFITEPLPDRPLVMISPFRAPFATACVYRMFDLLLATAALPLVVPLIAILGAAMKREAPGPILYRQRRLGLHGQPFEMIKLRTMPDDAEDGTGPVWAGEDDPRATPLGRKLRHLGLDELPQILHVLDGTMSIVGPRPERDFFAIRYPRLAGRRLLVRPGLTGLAQVQLRKDVTVDEKTRFDHWFISHLSTTLYMTICLRTARKFAERVAEMETLPIAESASRRIAP